MKKQIKDILAGVIAVAVFIWGILCFIFPMPLMPITIGAALLCVWIGLCYLLWTILLD